MYTPAFCVIAFTIIFSLFASATADDSSVKIILRSSFTDSEGRVNVVGTVRNFGSVPAQVTVGVLTDDGRIIRTPTYGRIVWPLTDSPFKFVLEPNVSSGQPFIIDIKEEAQLPNYNLLVLSYDGMAVGAEKAFVGKVKNTAPFDIHNVSVFAAVHSPDHKSQLDTVRSNIIPVIESGEELDFIAIPDAAVSSDILFYSCAGLDYDAPVATLEAGGGQLIPFSLSALAQISSLRYENASDSITFGIRYYMPVGGPVSLKIPQFSTEQTITVLVDGQMYDNASVVGDGKTMYIDFIVPDGEHQVQIQGVRNVPELPFGAFTLAVLTAIAIAIAVSVSKTSPKIS